MFFRMIRAALTAVVAASALAATLAITGSTFVSSARSVAATRIFGD